MRRSAGTQRHHSRMPPPARRNQLYSHLRGRPAANQSHTPLVQLHRTFLSPHLHKLPSPLAQQRSRLLRKRSRPAPLHTIGSNGLQVVHSRLVVAGRPDLLKDRVSIGREVRPDALLCLLADVRLLHLQKQARRISAKRVTWRGAPACITNQATSNTYMRQRAWLRTERHAPWLFSMTMW